MKESQLIKIFDGDTLVGLELDCDVATKPQPDLFEREIKRIFDEHKQLRTENEQIKAKTCEMHRHIMWVAMEFGKVLQERVDLQKELKALKEPKDAKV